MNKYIKLLCGLAATTMMFSCSSDEPNGPVTGGDEQGTDVMYLSVNIQDATQSRALADNIGDANEGDYIYGNADEHEVSNARFFFYNEAGVFVTEASVWTGGNPSTDKNENIEYIGDNVLVLRNLKSDNLPVYLVTVLNAPAKFKATPFLKDMAKQTFDSYLNGSNFIMSTTSFDNTNNTAPQKDNYETDYTKNGEYYFANKLKSTDFSKEPITDANASTVTKVDVYVERLAAKFTMSGALKNGNVFPVEVTVAGNGNTNIGGNTSGTGVGATKMYVKFKGWAVNATEPTSYLSKNLDGFLGQANIGTGNWGGDGWNKPSYYRSFWGKSVQYGTDPTLNYTTWEKAAVKPVTDALYSFECTNEPEYITTSNGTKINTAKVTHVVFAASVYADEACTQAPDLVLYNGVYFQKDQYLKYVLNSLKAELNYYVKTSESIVEVEGYTPTVIGEYQQIGPADVTLAKGTKRTGDVVVKSNIAEGTQLYTKNEEGKFVEVTDPTALDNLLAKFNEFNQATAYTGGAMVYYVPVEHLVAMASPIVEGNYGVVRNHWYDIDITRVFRLGEGVFIPETGSEEEPGKPEELIPDDPNGDTFGLGARVNILSWKIVKQKVEL